MEASGRVVAAAALMADTAGSEVVATWARTITAAATESKIAPFIVFDGSNVKEQR